MRNKIVIAVGLTVILFLSFLVFLINNSPLYIVGHSSSHEPIQDKEGNFYVVSVNPENNGFADIRITDVLVNNSDKPKRVELGISRSNYMVTIAEAVGEANEGISFHKIEDYPIKTPPKQEYEDGVFDTIRDYGIIVYHEEEIKNVLIQYNYLGIPFEKQVYIQELDED